MLDEIDTWGQFHQHFTQSFYVRRSQRHKNTVKPSVFFALLESARVQACPKNVGEIWWPLAQMTILLQQFFLDNYYFKYNNYYSIYNQTRYL